MRIDSRILAMLLVVGAACQPPVQGGGSDADGTDAGRTDAGVVDAGSAKDGGTDPCTIKNGGCDHHATCMATSATTTSCTCNPGYEGNGLTCTAANKCLENNGGCDPHATCTPTGPTTNTCTCESGYQGNGITCTPTDPCVTNHGGCDPNATCTATTSTTSTCTCNSGYQGNGVTCTAVNNCLENNGGCDPHATCTSTGPATNTCTCESGYEGNGVTCTPSDPCATNHGGCDANAICTAATPSTNTCTCKSGYQGNGVTCTPINPCATNNGGCAANATCAATGPGTNTCTCNSGYLGNGFTCTSVMQTLRVEMPCTGSWPGVAGLCTVNTQPVTSTITLPGNPNETYQVQVRIRGVMEYVLCQSCSTQGWCAGVLCGNDGWGDNVFSLQAGSTPYTLNANLGTNGHPSGYDFTESFTAQGGAQLTLTANPENNSEQRNNDGNNFSGQPIVINGIPPAPQWFDGQFVQVDIVSMTPVP